MPWTIMLLGEVQITAGKVVVAQEVGAGPAALEHRPGHGVQVGRGHPGLGRRPGLLVHLRHDLAGPAHFGQLFVVTSHYSAHFLALGVDGPHHPAGHRIG